MAVPKDRFWVLVIPYSPDAFPDVAYALFRSRGDRGCWHPVRGAGCRRETPLQAARRHAQQAGVPSDGVYVALDSRATIAVEPCHGPCALPEYAFAVRVEPADLRVPAEHEHSWVSYEVARGLVQRESERDALWELRRRFGRRAACS